MSQSLFSKIVKRLFGSKRVFSRPTRVNLRFLDVYFKPQHDANMFRLENISLEGMAFSGNDFEAWPQDGGFLWGKLYLRDKSYNLKLELVHKTNGLVGCRVLSCPDYYEEDLKLFFDVEFSAHHLTSIDPRILKESREGIPYYYYGKNQNELFYVINEEDITVFNVVLNKKFISGGKGVALKTGDIIKDVSDKVHGYKRVDPVSWDDSVSENFLVQVKRFIENIPGIEKGHVQNIANLLE